MPADESRARTQGRIEQALFAISAGLFYGLLGALLPMLWTAAAWSTGMRPEAPAIVLATGLALAAIGAGIAYKAGRFDKSAQLAAVAALGIAAVLVFPTRPTLLLSSPSAATSPMALALALAKIAGIPIIAVAASLWMLVTSQPWRASRWSPLAGAVALVAYPLIIEPMAPLEHMARLWTFALAATAVVAAALTAWQLNSATPGNDRPDRRTIVQLVAHTAIPSAAIVAIMTELAGTLTPLPLPASVVVMLAVLSALLPMRLGTGQAVALPLPSPSFLAMTLVVAAVLALPESARYRLPLALIALCIGTAIHARQGRKLVRSAPEAGVLVALTGLALGAGISIVMIHGRLLPPLPVCLILLVCASPSIAASGRSARRIAAILLLSLAAALVLTGLSGALSWPSRLALAAVLATTAIPLLRLTHEWPEQNIAVAAGLMTAAALFPSTSKTIASERGSWSPFRIIEKTATGERQILSGTTTIARHPSTDHHKLARLYDAVRDLKRTDSAARPGEEMPLLIGIAGIEGAPTCAAASSDVVRYFANDGATARLSTDPRWIPNYSQCTPAARIVTGDLRATLMAEPDDAFDILVLDSTAFPAPPFHLLDAKGLATLLAKIAPAGLLIIRTHASPVALTPWLARQLTATPGQQSATIGDDLIVVTRSTALATAIAAWPDANGVEQSTNAAAPHHVDLPAALRFARGAAN